MNAPTTADLATWLHDTVSQRRDAALVSGDGTVAEALSAVQGVIDVYQTTGTQTDTFPWLDVLTTLAIPYATEPGYRTDHSDGPA